MSLVLQWPEVVCVPQSTLGWSTRVCVPPRDPNSQRLMPGPWEIPKTTLSVCTITKFVDKL